MKIQIDTIAKKISLEESVKFSELIDVVSKLLPDDLWKEFTLETHTIINWQSPIIIKEYPVYPYVQPYTVPYTPQSPIYPYPTYPWITYGGDQSDHIMLCNGTYNVDIQVKD